jgi:tetratricopeptide (TPR) repeat protein
VTDWATNIEAGARARHAREFDVGAKHFAEALALAKESDSVSGIYVASFNLAYCLSALDRFDESIELYLEALRIRHAHIELFRDSYNNPFSDLVTIYVHLNRMDDLEQLAIAEVEFNREKFGTESGDYLGACMSLANVCSRFLEKHEKAVALYRTVIAEERRSDNLPALRMSLMNFERVLRAAGLESEADSTMIELYTVNERLNAQTPRGPSFLDLKRQELSQGKITEAELRDHALAEVGSQALDDSPLLEEYNFMLRQYDMGPNDPRSPDHWKERCADLIAEFKFTDEEVYAAGRKLIANLEKGILDFQDFHL